MYRTWLIAIIVLSVIGVADSGYAISQHYAPAGESGCNVSATVNCDAVNQSEYSELMGVPVAAIGTAGYLFFIVLAVMLLADVRLRGFTLLLLLGASLVALAYSLFLTFIEIFVLGAVCPMCMISLALVTAITAMAIVVAVREQRKRAGNSV